MRVAPLSGYRSPLDFKSCDLSAEQPLGDDPLLGRGRNAQDPYRGLITDEGKSRSRSMCAARALAHRAVWRSDGDADEGIGAHRVRGPAGGEQHDDAERCDLDVRHRHAREQPDADRRQLGRDADGAGIRSRCIRRCAGLSKCTYTANTADDRLEIQFNTAGTGANAFTLAASANSNGTASGPTLTGGGYEHDWTSRAAMPSPATRSRSATRS